MNLLTFLFKRERHYWQLLLTLSLGVLLSTALLAGGPVLVNTVVEFGLRRTLLSGSVLDGNVQVSSVAFNGHDLAAYQTLDEQVQTLIQTRLGEHVAQIVPAGGTFWASPWLNEQLVTNQRLNFYFYDEVSNSHRLLLSDGNWPTQTILSTQPIPVVTGVIGEEMAVAYGLGVGDRLPLNQNRNETEPSLWLEVAAIARPDNPNDPFWFGDLNPLTVQIDNRWRGQYHIIVPVGDFWQLSETIFPGTRPELDWNVILAAESITTVNMSTLSAQLERLKSDLQQTDTRPVLNTNLTTILQTFTNQSNTIRPPLLLLTTEIVLLTLYYVMMVAALSLRQVEREFATFASRGLTSWQIFRFQLIEALLIGLVAFISGPILGAGLVRGLALVGPLRDVGQSSWPLTITASAWLSAAIGAIACLVGLLLPAGPAARRSIIAHQQEMARTTRQPLWQRAYLDVFALLIGLILLWRLQIYGGIVGGNGGVDWLLLLSPLALLLGAGTILLRLFPLLMRFGAGLAALGRGLPAALSFWQLSRNPTHTTRLVLLLTLAMALGILSTGLNVTLDRSEFERAYYVAGSDLRLVSRRSVPLDQVASLSGVAAWSGIWRGHGSIPAGRTYVSVELLGIDPTTVQTVTLYRDDFASRPMPQTLALLNQGDFEPQPVTPLPGNPRTIGIWLWSPPDPEENSSPNPRRQALGDSDLDRVALQLKLVTAQGQLFTVSLQANETGGYPAGGWRYFWGDVTHLSPISYPLSLHSIWLQNQVRVTRFNGSQRAEAQLDLALDDLTITDWANETPFVVESFDLLTRIWQSNEPEANTYYDPTQPHSGRGRLRFNYAFDSGQFLGFSLVTLSRPDILPALGSPTFFATTQTKVGDIVRLTIESGITLRFQIIGDLTYFPTMYESDTEGFLITAQQPLLEYLNQHSDQAINSNELLLTVGPQPGRNTPTTLLQTELTALTEVSQIIEANTVRKTIKADPMSLGLRSVTYFGYVLTTTLSLVGFATYFYLSARQREATYAILRSIGLSPSQLYGVLVLEQLVLILFGLALGTALGMILNQITLPGLPITLGNQAPIPPFQVLNDWAAVGRIYLVLALAFLLAIGFATLLLVQTRLHRVLRIGEE